MDEPIQLGVLVPTGQSQWGEGADARRLIDFAIRAERLGYDSLFVNDSLLTPRIEPLTMLAALASVTGHATLGTGALLPFLRRPVQTAQTLASIDRLSGGRLVVAVGAGFPGRFGQPLYRLSDTPWERRFARLDETVALWRQLWVANGPTSFHCQVLCYEDVPPSTTPFRAGGPPIWLGGATPTALVRTGRLYDGWLPYPPDSADYRMGLDNVRRAAADAGRSPDVITPALFVSVLVAENVDDGRQSLGDYSSANYGLPLHELEKVQAVVAGPRDYVVSHLSRYTDAGARHLVVRIGALDLAAQLDQLDRVAEIIPIVKR
jgi:alkanesulfonate monooxygenase SsuD/methylene tetrahydromethanopterin reductase-like flavin-dependent oxidoreductase (luciferase family)